MAVATLLPGVDVPAVIGAFAGALFFVVFSSELSALARVGYLVSSWVFGYFAAVEAVSRGWLGSTGLAAAIGGLLCVTVCVSLLEWIQSGKTPVWLGLLSRKGKP